MAKLLMISGDRSLAEGKRGAFYNTLEEFHKYWDRIDIICPKTSRGSISKGSTSNPPEVEPLFGEPLFGNVYIHPSPWPLVLQPFWILKKGREIYREQKFDLMTVHEYPPFYNGLSARMLWGKIQVPYILEIHHIPGYPKASGFKEWLYKTAAHCFIKYDAAKAAAVRVVNQHQVPEFLLKTGVPKSKIVYIPSMYIDLDTFKPITNYQLPITKQYDLIFIGRLTKNKGINLLLEAASKLKTQIINFKLLIVGSGPLVKFLKFKIENLKLHDNVVLHGWAKDPQEIAQLLNQSKMLVMPSYNEGGPRVVLEAMACGVPVITTKVGLMPDIIHDGENGLFADWNSTGMADKIIFLLKNQELQSKFSKSGLNLVQKFEKKSAIRNYAEKLQENI